MNWALPAMMLAMSVMPSFAADLEANKKTVLEFYEAGLNNKDFDAAAKYLWPEIHPAQPRRTRRHRGLQDLCEFPARQISKFAQ